MFKRRTKHGVWRKLREITWPSIGFKRAFHYIANRITRLAKKDGGHALSKSIACGVAASFFPAMGVHAALAALMAFLMRAPMVAAMLGTLLVPPFILPFLFVLDFVLGSKVLETLGFKEIGSEDAFEEETAEFDPTWFFDHFQELFFPALIGFLIFLPLVWSASYMATRKVIKLTQKHLANKRKAKQKS